MVILPAMFSKLSKAWSSLAYSTGSSFTYSSPGSTQSKNTCKGPTINHGAMHKQHDAKHGMTCGMWYAMHMRALEGQEWTMHQLGKPSVPLDRGDEIAWKRYKDHWNRSYGLEMASVLRYDTGLRFTASRHLNATKWTCYSHQTWKQNTWQWCTQDGWQNTSTEP